MMFAASQKMSCKCYLVRHNGVLDYGIFIKTNDCNGYANLFLSGSSVEIENFSFILEKIRLI